jgi:spore germination cell wall hydrolase CwlJ-like protein
MKMWKTTPIIVSFLILTFTTYWITYDDQEQEVQIPLESQTQNESTVTEQTEPESAELPERDRSRVNGFEKSELLCLSLNIYHESRSDNLAGRISVADVVLNRVDSTLFPNTVCGVVHQAKTRVNWKGNVVPVRGMCHFSWYCDGMSDEPLEEDAWEDAQIVAELALNGGWRGISEGATHYHATYVEPNWINDRGMVPVGRIGEHKFYRWH